MQERARYLEPRSHAHKLPLIVLIMLCGPSLLMFWNLEAALIEEVDLQLPASTDMLRLLPDVVRAVLPHSQMLMEKDLVFPIQLLVL